MRIRLGFKTPDVVEDAVAEEMARRKYGHEDEVYEDLKHEAIQACAKWVKYGESITVEVDTEKGTCEVVPV